VYWRGGEVVASATLAGEEWLDLDLAHAPQPPT
jgi:hypothetical protein